MNRLISTSLIALLLTAPSYANDEFDSESDESKPLSVRAPRSGPVLGRQAPISEKMATQRVWIQAEQGDQLIKPTYRGIVRWRMKGADKWHQKEFALSADHNYAGIVEIDVVRGGEYEYKVGYTLRPGDERISTRTLDWVSLPKDAEDVYERTHGSVFQVTPAQPDIITHFMGSCDYWSPPVSKVQNTWFKLKQFFTGTKGLKASAVDTVGKVFPIMEARLATSKPRVVALLGDQVYRDHGNKFWGAHTEGDFDDIYTHQWGADPEKAKIWREVPTVYGLDDHETHDNCNINNLAGSAGTHTGLRFARSYQMMNTDAFDPETGITNRYWYETMTGGIPMFIMDTRYERKEGKRIMSPKQMEAIKAFFLKHNGKGPMILAMASPMGMPYKANDPRVSIYRNDSWVGPGYERDLCEILDFLADNKIKGVMSYAGDVHWAGACQIVDGLNNVLITQATSSPFDWPELFSGLESANVVVNGDIVTSPKSGRTYSNTNVIKPILDNNFGQITYDMKKGTVDVQIITYDARNPLGQVAGKKVYQLWTPESPADPDDVRRSAKPATQRASKESEPNYLKSTISSDRKKYKRHRVRKSSGGERSPSTQESHHHRKREAL